MSDDAWARGLELFNAGAYFEAHEAWEDLWRDAARDSNQRLALQGLIQLSAALLKLQQGNERGARRLAARSVEKLERARLFRGLDLAALAATMRTRMLDATGPLVFEDAVVRL
jgi:hypothetical protein